MSVVAGRPWSKTGIDWRHRVEHRQLGVVNIEEIHPLVPLRRDTVFHSVEEAPTHTEEQNV